MTTNSLLYSNLLNKFPRNRIKFAFAYGSEVLKQSGAKTNRSNDMFSRPMVDFVFVVDNEIRFHDENLKMNSSHYSFLKWIGPYYLSRFQNEIGAGCYYNTLVPLKIDDGLSKSEQEYMIKYGIIG